MRMSLLKAQQWTFLKNILSTFSLWAITPYSKYLNFLQLPLLSKISLKAIIFMELAIFRKRSRISLWIRVNACGMLSNAGTCFPSPCKIICYGCSET